MAVEAKMLHCFWLCIELYFYCVCFFFFKLYFQLKLLQFSCLFSLIYGCIGQSDFSFSLFWLHQYLSHFDLFKSMSLVFCTIYVHYEYTDGITLYSVQLVFQLKYGDKPSLYEKCSKNTNVEKEIDMRKNIPCFENQLFIYFFGF